MVNYRPTNLAFITTDGCNANCDYCGIQKSSHSQRLSLETMQDYIDQAKRYGMWTVSFSGGEPSLLGEDLFIAINHVHKNGMLSGLVTNGSYAKDEKTGKEVAKRLFDSGLNFITISMDQSHSEFIPYERSFNAFKGALQYNLNPSISVTDLKSTHFRNWVMLKKIAEDLGGEFEGKSIIVKGKKITEYDWTRAHREGEAKKLDKREFKFRKIKYNEECKSQAITVRSDGKVAAPCCTFPSVTQDFYVMGNAKDTTIEEVVEKTNNSVIGSVLIGPSGIGRVGNVLASSKDRNLRRMANRNYTSKCEFCGDVFSNHEARELIVKKFERLKDTEPKVVFKEGYFATEEFLARVAFDGKKKRSRFITFLGPIRKDDFDIARYSHNLDLLEDMEKEQGELSEYTDDLKMKIETLQQRK